MGRTQEVAVGTKSESRRQKQAEKKRKARDEARSTRGSRPGQGGKVDLGTALRWSPGECYLSSNWPEQGARVQAVFTRRSPAGRVALAFFDVDLGERGVVQAEARMASDLEVQGLLAQLSQSGMAMVAREPALVVKLVRAGVAHGTSTGHEAPASYARIARLFGDVDPARATDEIRVGTVPSSTPPPAKPGVLDAIKRRLFGG
jgi:hypothetical protein